MVVGSPPPEAFDPPPAVCAEPLSEPLLALSGWLPPTRGADKGPDPPETGAPLPSPAAPATLTDAVPSSSPTQPSQAGGLCSRARPSCCFVTQSRRCSVLRRRSRSS